MMKEKIKNIEELPALIENLRQANKKIVLCHGVFDLLHIGHIRHFRRAREFGDILVVTISADRFVDKGPGRPAFTETLRAEAAASLAEVDYVAINAWPTAEETLRLLRPDFFAKGSEFKQQKSDYTGKIDKELAVVKEIGAEMVFTEDVVFSSSNLINRFLSDKTEETNEYLNIFRERYTIEDIHKILDDMSNLKVMVIGDTILDDYHYCDAMGKSNKDPVLALQYKSNDLFCGGILAVANHAANFAKEVLLVTTLGEVDGHEDFIRKNLHPKVTPHFMIQPGAPTLIKRRFLDGYSFSKLFEVYIMDDSGLPPEQDAELRQWVENKLDEYDLVIAADFGHGMISEQMVQTLTRNKCFLAVNTQANAGNRGFHTISRYPRADFVSLAEHEIRLDTRQLNGPLRPIMDKHFERLSCQTMVVTSGRRGAVVKGQNEYYMASPSLTSQVVDRIGAGDAFFTVTSMAAKLKIDEELIGFIGNVVGALAVGVIGNQKSIDKMSVKKYATHLMK